MGSSRVAMEVSAHQIVPAVFRVMVHTDAALWLMLSAAGTSNIVVQVVTPVTLSMHRVVKEATPSLGLRRFPRYHYRRGPKI